MFCPSMIGILKKYPNENQQYLRVPIVVGNQALPVQTALHVRSYDSQLMESCPSALRGWNVHYIAQTEDVLVFIVPECFDIDIKESYSSVKWLLLLLPF